MCQYFHYHDDVIKWKHFPRYLPFVWGIHRRSVNSLHKGHWCGALMFSLICVWINDWVNNREAGDLRRHRGHYDVTVMIFYSSFWYLTFIVTYISDTNQCCYKYVLRAFLEVACLGSVYFIWGSIVFDTISFWKSYKNRCWYNILTIWFGRTR